MDTQSANTQRLDTFRLNPPDVSILICTRDRRPMLDNLLKDLVGQDYQKDRLEIVIIEETNEPRPINGTKYIAIPVHNRGMGYARNKACKNASHPILVFIDDDCHADSTWLRCLLTPLNSPDVVGIQGGVKAFDSDGAIGWAESILGFPGGGIRRVLDAKGEILETKEISTLNCAYRKWVVDKVGGFDESLKLGGEDYLLAKQVCQHGRCLFVPAATVSHEARKSLIKIWHWFIRRGRAEIGVIKTGKYKEANMLSLLKASLLFKLIILVTIGFVFSDNSIFILLSALIFYCGLQLHRYYKTWKITGTNRKVLALIPLVKLTMDFASDIGRIRGLIFD